MFGRIRRRVNKRRSMRLFKRTALKFHRHNRIRRITRGGYRR